MRYKTLIPKSEARRQVLERRAELSEREILQKSIMIIDRLKNQDDFLYARNIFAYISTRHGEVDTRQLIDLIYGMGKSIILPKLNKISKTFHRFNFMGWDSLVKTSDGYYEPKLGIDEDLSDIDLILLPAVAVSVKGQRVGNGGGYYDKMLKHSQTPKYVLAFEFQIFDYIESTTEDIRADKIITERRVINTREISFNNDND